MNELRESINKIKRTNNEHIWLAGDFNLPDIDWTNQVQFLQAYQNN